MRRQITTRGERRKVSVNDRDHPPSRPSLVRSRASKGYVACGLCVQLLEKNAEAHRTRVRVGHWGAPSRGSEHAGLSVVMHGGQSCELRDFLSPNVNHTRARMGPPYHTQVPTLKYKIALRPEEGT